MVRFETRELKLSYLIQVFINAQPEKDWKILAIDPHLDIVVLKREVEENLSPADAAAKEKPRMMEVKASQ